MRRGAVNSLSIDGSGLRIKQLCASTYRSIHFVEQHVLCPLLTYNLRPMPIINGKWDAWTKENSAQMKFLSPGVSTRSDWNFLWIPRFIHIFRSCIFSSSWRLFISSVIYFHKRAKYKATLEVQIPVSPIFIDQKVIRFIVRESSHVIVPRNLLRSFSCQLALRVSFANRREAVWHDRVQDMCDLMYEISALRHLLDNWNRNIIETTINKNLCLNKKCTLPFI